MISYNEKEKALRLVQELNFTVIEASLYLDGHPHNKKALEYFKRQREQLGYAVHEYEKKYGPLTVYGTDENWDWAKSPWPWELEERCV